MRQRPRVALSAAALAVLMLTLLPSHRPAQAQAASGAVPAAAQIPATQTPGIARYLGTYVWRAKGPGFGGFSGLEIDDAGTGMTVLSDRAQLWRGQIRRDADGLINGVDVSESSLLHDKNGKILTVNSGDTEGLAVAPDGTIFISFEGRSRVMRYQTPGGVATELPVPKAFKAFASNASLEALAIGPDGALYTMPEDSGKPGKPFPVYRFKGGKWDQPFNLPRDGQFLTVGADFGPDGRLYVLQRWFHGISGFSSRVQRYDLTVKGISAPELVLQTQTGDFDNLEGISVWRDASGAIRLTMVSDDNFMFFQQTQLVEFSIPAP
ncbi:esterase-like activity of phytase family protein [Phaeovulum sp. W22_SRMD_FR3]|uniref:esterase-like activity of phytase family protein n=1 Tax=Phaeovulum sp. W22_SRMD_FR3 TaxID=3240274 RepID=UPI003F9B9C2D